MLYSFVLNLLCIDLIVCHVCDVMIVIYCWTVSSIITDKIFENNLVHFTFIK